MTLPVALAVFALAAAVIAVAGTRLSGVADRLADRTGWGEAIVGGVFLGAVTSLSGVVTSVTAGARGLPELAASNAVGGIAAQTAFLVLADLAYRGVNLEHAAASLGNLFQGTLLVVLLGLVLVAIAWPEPALAGVHPVSLLLPVVWGLGIVGLREARERPMWGPRRTSKTREDVPEEPRSRGPDLLFWGRLLLLGAVVSACGFAMAASGEVIAARTPLSETAVGGLLTAVATSLPELVTTLAAVRRRALALAVGGILGGNTFDVLFLSFSDLAYREGSLYAAVSDRLVLLLALTLVMSGTLVLGLLRREEHGPANIGFESSAVLVLYVGGMVAITLS